MPWNIIIARRALKDLEHLSSDDQTAVRDKISQLVIDPSSVDLKKLVGTESEWRMRVGHWRVIVELDNNAGQIRVLRVKSRKEAYN
jgi:mRNA interferase RelE/StbE